MAAINELYRRTRGVIVQEDGWRFRRNLNGTKKIDSDDGQLSLGLEFNGRGWYTITDSRADFELKIFERVRR